jgi:hypothetical protein
MLRIMRTQRLPLSAFHEKFAVQLNDTHPAIAVAELMRLLVDVHDMAWDEAWAITRRSFAYTNHTLLPEALERWPLPLFGRVLPRHLEIIYEINAAFMTELRERFPGEDDLLSRLSLIDEHGERRVEQRERHALQQADLHVREAEVLLDRADQQVDDLAVDERDDARDAEHEHHPPRVRGAIRADRRRSSPVQGDRIARIHRCSPWPRIQAAARSAIIIVAPFVLPLIGAGMMEASTTLSRSMPRTRSCGSTTESASAPIRQVPIGW